MQEQEILKGNKLIWFFMDKPSLGFTPTKTEDFKYSKYHISWDWLMPVVEKIDNTFLDQMQLSTRIGEKNFVIYGTHIFTEGNNKIEAVWKGVVEFIK